MFYITFFMFCYTLFNIYQLNLTVTNYQISYPSSQKSYPIVKIVIIPTLLSDYQFPPKISTYSIFLNSKITTYDNFPNLKIRTYKHFPKPKLTTYINSISPSRPPSLSGWQKTPFFCQNWLPNLSLSFHFIPLF